MQGAYAPGSLVKARGRDWIVLPESDPDVLRVRPLTSAHQSEEGLFLPLEGDQIRSASFVDPDPARCGDATGVMALFADWICAPERRTRQTFAALEIVLERLLALLGDTPDGSP